MPEGGATFGRVETSRSKGGTASGQVEGANRQGRRTSGDIWAPTASGAPTRARAGADQQALDQGAARGADARAGRGARGAGRREAPGVGTPTSTAASASYDVGRWRRPGTGGAALGGRKVVRFNAPGSRRTVRAGTRRRARPKAALASGKKMSSPGGPVRLSLRTARSRNVARRADAARPPARRVASARPAARPRRGCRRPVSIRRARTSSSATRAGSRRAAMRPIRCQKGKGKPP